mgnify:CR=1 FL=1
MIEALLLGILAFVLFLAAHFLVFHHLKPHHRWTAVMRVFWACLIFYMLAFWLLPFPNWFDILNLESPLAKWIAFAVGASWYVFLFLSYAQFYFLVDRGISARILVEVLRAQGETLSHDELRRRYSSDELQTRRLDDMRYGKYVVLENGVYTLTAKGKLNALIFDFCKKYLHLNPGG